MAPSRGPAPRWVAKVVEYDGAVLLRIPVSAGVEGGARLLEQGAWFGSWLEGRGGVTAVGPGTWRLRDRELGDALVAELFDAHGGEAIDADRYFAILDPAPSLYAQMPPRSGDARRWLVKVDVEPYRGEQVMGIPVGGYNDSPVIEEQGAWFDSWLEGRDGVEGVWYGTWRLRDLALARALVAELVEQGAERIDHRRYLIHRGELRASR